MIQNLALNRMASRIWENAVTLDDATAKLFLMRCRLTVGEQNAWLLRDQVRFHPGLIYQNDAAELIAVPGLIARIRQPDGSLAGHHFLLQSEAGLQEITCLEPECANVRYAAIQLRPAQAHLYIADSLQQALALFLQTGQACWSVMAAPQLATFVPPMVVERISLLVTPTLRGVNQLYAHHFNDRMQVLGVRSHIFLKQEIELESNPKNKSKAPLRQKEEFWDLIPG